VKITMYSIFGINLRKLFLLFPWQPILKTNHYSIYYFWYSQNSLCRSLSDIIFQLESTEHWNYQGKLLANYYRYYERTLFKLWVIQEMTYQWVSDYCLTPTPHQLYHGENKLIFNWNDDVDDLSEFQITWYNVLLYIIISCLNTCWYDLLFPHKV